MATLRSRAPVEALLAAQAFMHKEALCKTLKSTVGWFNVKWQGLHQLLVKSTLPTFAAKWGPTRLSSVILQHFRCHVQASLHRQNFIGVKCAIGTRPKYQRDQYIGLQISGQEGPTRLWCRLTTVMATSLRRMCVCACVHNCCLCRVLFCLHGFFWDYRCWLLFVARSNVITCRFPPKKHKISAQLRWRFEARFVGF